MLKSTINSSRVRFSGLFSTILALFFAYQAPGAQNRFLENGNATVHGNDAGTFIDTPTRLKIDLSGEWEYVSADGGSGSVRIPAAFDGKGKVRFSRTFSLTQDQLDHYVFELVMLGGSYSCDVSVNGEFVGSHGGGYTSFIQTLSKDYLQAGNDNRLQITVDPALNPRTTLPTRPLVWQQHNYGGILRDIFIVAVPVQHITDVVVRTELPAKGPNATIRVRASVNGFFPPVVDTAALRAPKGSRSRPTPQPVPGFYFEVMEKGSDLTVATSKVIPLVRAGDAWQDVQASASIVNPRLWSPDTPDLYVMKCYLVLTSGKDVSVVDEYDVISGVRTIAIDDGNFMLNGHRLVVKGVIWNEQHPSWGSSVPYEQMEKDVVLIKNLGANLIRFADHPPHPYMLDLCDRYGLMAMEELPVDNVPALILGAEPLTELAVSMIKELVTRDRNHPSVLAWGVGDGFEVSGPESAKFVEAVVGAARTLDDRPLYYGACAIGPDVCSKLVDIAALDIPGGDLKAFRTLAENWRNEYPDKPVVVSRFGVEVQQDNRNGYSDPRSQEAQARFFTQRLEALKSLDYDGAIIWSFNDWRGDRPAMTVHGKDPLLCSVGLVSEARDKRLAYEAVRAAYRGEKFLAVPAGSYSSDAPIVYVLTGFVVLVGVAYLYNANRRFRESVNRSVFNTYNFFADVRDQRAVSLLHTTVLAAVVSMATATIFSSIALHFRDNLFLDNFLSMVLVSDRLKSAVVRLIWSPFEFIVAFTILFFVKLFLISLLVLLLKFFFRSRIFMFHAYSVTIWSATPLLLFIPVGMILHRVMESQVYVVPTLIFVGVLLLWVAARLLKGISIIFDISATRIYILGLLVVGVGIAVLYFYYSSTAALPEYAAYLYRLAVGS